MIGRNYVQGKNREEVIGKIGFSHFVVVDKNVAKKYLLLVLVLTLASHSESMPMIIIQT